MVIRKDLNMRKGKIAAQAAHASMKWIIDSIKDSKNQVLSLPEGTHAGVLIWTEGTAVADWLEGSFTKITVAVNSEAELLAVYETAKAEGIIASLIQDEGRTEFGGVPTHTAVAIGPDWSEKIDPITGHLALL